MEIKYLREFIVLAECLNYTVAANRLFISQPTLSKHITALEEEMHAQLFNRSTQGVRLTAAGKILLESGNEMIRIYEKTILDMEQLSNGTKGQLDVGMLYYGADELVLPVIHQMFLANPDIKISLRSHQPKGVKEDLENNKIDLAETYDLGNFSTQEYGVQNIQWEYFSAVVPAGHRLAEKEAITLQDLDKEPLIIADQQPDLNEFKIEYMKKNGIHIGAFYHTEHIDTIPLAVAAYNGVAVLLRHCTLSPRKNVKYVPIEEPDFRVMMSYFWKKQNQNPCIQPFVDTVRTIFSS